MPPARTRAAPAPARRGATPAPSPRGGGPAVQGTAGPPARIPGNAAKDPRFKKVMDQIDQGAAKTKTHPSPAQKANEAQAAARSPGNERLATAQVNQVDTMKGAQTGKPDPNS